MRKYSIIVFACVCLAACNNESKENTTVDTDTTVNSQADLEERGMNNAGGTADAATADFLVKAADGGLAEVSAGQVAQSKAVNESVKLFASMMISDHTAANQQVKDFASRYGVALPSAASEEHQKKIDDVNKKEGKAFDKAYMSLMVDDHKKTIDLFKDAAGKAGNEEVKNFINNTIPKLQLHLDSAQAIEKRL